jgi:hypothetical protein
MQAKHPRKKDAGFASIAMSKLTEANGPNNKSKPERWHGSKKQVSASNLQENAPKNCE